MVAFRVQDDTGSVDDANAYVTKAEMRSYWAERGVDLTATLDASLEAAIVKATQYLDARFRFVGIRENDDQGTMWPRVRAVNLDGRVVQGVPMAVKKATYEYANRALTSTLSPDPTYDTTGQKVQAKSSSVDPISESVTYVSGATFSMPAYPAADRLMTSEGIAYSGGSSREMVRA